MIKPVIILSFFILPITVLAQKKSTWNKTSTHKGYQGETWTISRHLAFKATPTSLLDIYGALLPLGLEYYFGDRYGISFDAGIPLYYVLNNYRDDKPQKTVNSDFKLRADVRQYFRLREHTRMYYGAELFFRQQEMRLSDSYLHFIDDNCYDYTLINARKHIYGTGALLGLCGKLTEHLIIEGHIGLGIRVINMKTDLDKANLVPKTEKSFISWIPPNGDRVGDRDINAYIPFAIKIAYLF